MSQEMTMESLGMSSESPPGLTIESSDDGRSSPAALSQSSMTSQDSCHMEDAELHGVMDVAIRPPRHTVQRTLSIGRQMPAYQMNADPRGVALIIANEKYVNQVQEERLGSEVDRINLKHLFESLHFVVEEAIDCSKMRLLELLDKFASDKRHDTADMMVLIVLSHGQECVINTADGQSVDIEKIFESFNNTSCPKLKGKPKFFIIQACRGGSKDTGAYEEVRDDQIPPRQTRRRTRGDVFNSNKLGTDAHPISTAEQSIYNVRPTVEDMIVAYSTLPGYSSNRDLEKGTWFIQSLVEVFMNHAAEHELLDLLRMTSHRLSQFENASREKQTCNIEMRGLYKRLYFNVGSKNEAFQRNGKNPTNGDNQKSDMEF